MKRFFTRHMSLRRRGHYTLLSCSDSQLDRTLQSETNKGDSCDKTGDTKQNVSQFRRCLRKFSRRKKRRESETALVQAECTTRSCSTENFEIGVEASPCHDDEGTCAGHGTVTRSVSTSLLDMRNVGIDVEHCTTELNTARGLPVHEHIAQIHTASASSAVKPSYLQERRFAICEELERDIIMDNGVNLRKSRKNLVIRQVLHDLLLL